MATNSGIQWTTHTFNPWRGCTKVSPGCQFCYADTLSKRNPSTLGVWGPNGTRAPASESYWREPFKWDRWATAGVCPACGGTRWGPYRRVNGDKRASACGSCNGTGKADGPYRARVFCASLADVFEGPETMPEAGIPVVAAGRVRLFNTILKTPNLDWLLLTKRPENHRQMWQQTQWPRLLPNVWLGVSVEDGKRARRVDLLRENTAAVRFLSVEPLVGDPGRIDLSGIGWMIVGAESGAGRRSMDLAWVRSLRDQCREAGTAFFVKQMDVGGDVTGDIDQFPADLRIREFPTPEIATAK